MLHPLHSLARLRLYLHSMEAEVTAAGAAPMAVEVVASTVEAVAVFTAVVAAPAAGVAPTVAAHLRRVPMPGGRKLQRPLRRLFRRRFAHAGIQ